MSGLAYEAVKAPGGAYMHNIFHQSERARAASERKKDQRRKYCVL